MAKVILFSPSYVDLYGKLDGAAGRYFPLGLGYIAAYLRQYGNHVVGIYEMDAQRLVLDDIKGILKETMPDIVGLTCSTPNFFRAIELAKTIRKYSKAKIVLGGVHASALPEYIMDNYSEWIDYLIKGEGEATMLELVNACQNSMPVDSIQGLVYKGINGVVCNGDRPLLENLDYIPYPARDLIPQTLFRPNLHNSRYRKSLSIMTSRGCPFNCSFCASRVVSGIRYRVHSAEYVLGEMEMLKKDFKARQLLITDDTFTLNHERLVNICEGMITKQLNLTWFCFSQVNTVDRELLSIMKKAGCYSIGFGVEAADRETLEKMGKRISPEDAMNTIRLANRLGFKTQAFYVFGALNETKAQMENTIKFSQKVSSTLAFFNMLVPYPGTKDFQRYFPSSLLSNIEWDRFVAIGEHCVLEKSLASSREIEGLIAKAYIQYYINPYRLFMILFQIKTLYELVSYLKGFISLFSQISKWNKPKAKQAELLTDAPMI